MIEDLTEQSRSEEALSSLRERYALASAAGGVGVWDRDLATGALYLDPALYAMLGFAPTQLAPADLWPGRLHLDDRERALAATRTALAPDAPRDPDGHTPIPETECRVLHRDGGVRWFLARGRVLRRADGTPYRLIGTATEFTARKQHEVRLAMEYAVTRALGGAGGIAEIARGVLYQLAAGLGYDYAALWLAEAPGAPLRCVALRHVAGSAAPAFEAASRGATCAPGVDLPGRAWSSNNPALVRGHDAADPAPRQAAARAGGLAVGLGYPVRSGEAVVGALELYRRDPRPIEPETIAALHALGAQVGHFVARRRAEEALRRSEQRYRVLFEQASDPILIGTPELGFLDANAQACALLGYAREELLGRSAADLLTATPAEVAALGDALRGGAMLRVQRALRRKDGTTVPVEINARLLEDGRVLAIARDVGARERAEAALRASERRYRALFEQASDPIFIVGDDGATLDVNELGCELLGYRREELLAMPFPAYVVTNPEQFTATRAAFLAGSAVRVRRQLRRKDGTLVPVEIVLRTQEDGRIQAIARDMSERERAEAALRASEARFRGLAELSPDAILILQGGRYVYANRSAARICGAAEPGELVGRSPFALVGPADQARSRARLRRVLAGEPLEPAQFDLIRLDGARITVDAMGGLVSWDGAPAVQVLWRDATARLAAEAALRASEARFRALYDAGVLPICFWRADGGVGEANDALLALTGFGREELAAGLLRWDELTAPEHRDRDRRAFAEVIERGSCAPYEKDLLLRDGRRVPVLNGGMLLPGQAGGVAFVIDLSERKRAEERLRELTAQLLRTQDEERRRIARELHDVTAQDLFALTILLNRLARPGARLDRQGRETVAEARALGEQALRELRTQSYLLHPPLLDELGLAAALEWFVQGFTRRSGIAVALAVDAALGRLPEATELALFRVAQEGLGNVHRHAGSATARVALAREGNAVTLRVEDHGHGLPRTDGGDDTPAPTGVGLAGMRERLRSLGGHLALASSDRGTTLTAVVPLPHEAAR